MEPQDRNITVYATFMEAEHVLLERDYTSSAEWGRGLVNLFTRGDCNFLIVTLDAGYIITDPDTGV